MPIDDRSLSSGQPRTMDGRRYPRHLKAYERFDADFLERATGLPSPFTFDDLASATGGDARLRDVLSRWLASAEWRALLERHAADRHGPRTYSLTKRGMDRLNASLARRAA